MASPEKTEDRGNLKVGSFEILALVDADGHLTLAVKSTDGSPVMDIGEDVALSDDEFAVRLTSREIERQYNESTSRERPN